MKEISVVMTLILASIIFNGCVNEDGLTPQSKKEISELLELKEMEDVCEYPKLRVYKVPKRKKIPKGTSIEDAFILQNNVNNELRRICRTYRKGNLEVNRRFNK